MSSYFVVRWPSGCNPPGRCTFKDSPGTPRSSWPGWPRSCSPIMEELKYFLISSVQFYFKLSCLHFTGPGCRQLGLSTRRRGAQLEYTYPFLRQTESLEKIREYPRLFNIITLILEYTFILLNANTFFQGYHSLESSPTASHHLVTAMTPSPPLH